mgnify:CR=1 FL=1
MGTKKWLTKEEANIKIQARALNRQMGLGLTINEAVEIIKAKRRIALDVKKAMLTAYDNSISYAAFHKRVSRGWDLSIAATKPMEIKT